MLGASKSDERQKTRNSAAQNAKWLREEGCARMQRENWALAPTAKKGMTREAKLFIDANEMQLHNRGTGWGGTSSSWLLEGFWRHADDDCFVCAVTKMAAGRLVAEYYEKWRPCCCM